jgi:hypothetical protein
MHPLPIPALTANDAPVFAGPENPYRRNFGAQSLLPRSRERGAGHLKAIVFSLILVMLVYVGFKVIPLLINNYEFQDGLQDIARAASVNNQAPDKIRASVLKEAQQDDVPIQDGDIKIGGTSKRIDIKVDYSVTADLGAYQWTLNFHPSVSNDALF